MTQRSPIYLVTRPFRRAKSLWSRVSRFSPKLKNWWIYPLDIFGWLHKGSLYTFKYRNGMKVVFRAGTYDTLINFEIFGCGEYTHHFMADVSGFRRFIDLGAQTGVFALSLMVRNPSLQGICVEATGENFDVLNRNINQNGFASRIETLHRAVWGKTGEQLVIHMSNHNSGSHSVVIDGTGRRDGETVETISLKDLVGNERCDLLKLDIEGAEYEVLYNADIEILARIQRIVMEAHDVGQGKNASSAERFLLDKGFDVTREGRHLWATRR